MQLGDQGTEVLVTCPQSYNEFVARPRLGRGFAIAGSALLLSG